MNGNFSNEPIQKYCCVANDFGFDRVTCTKKACEGDSERCPQSGHWVYDF
ncbi:hypothetical protein ENLAB_25190 [Enterococcus innesii]|uniref:Uncharacterized protein n=1 Tax=Enterococcus innesii TaxID=2839759 RepID=A0ABM7XV02_9ENTE|nr:hypothetical protein ENLAB_25190 [Enterococcus innesii]